MNRFILSCLILFLAGCASKSAEEDTEQTTTTTEKPTPDQILISPEQLKAMDLQLGAASQTTVSDEVKTTGTVDVPPQYMASVSPLINGVIKSVNVLPGQRVGKGATLATLQSLDYIQMQQDYLQAISQLTYQQAELQRQKTLNAEEVGAKKRLQQAEADYGSNRALVSSLALKLQTLGTSVETLNQGRLSPVMRITSPVGGYVTASNIHLGQQVAMADVLFEVMDQTHKHLELSVFENDAFKIKNGQTILLNDPKLGTETVRGRVYLVGKAFSGDARTITIHGHVDNERLESRLIPGMFLNARILTGSRMATTLPEEAVVRKGQSGFIYIPTGEARTYRRIPVKLGQAEQGRIEVTLQTPVDLARVVIKGAYLLEAQLTKGDEEEE
ncbi:efflux RND transporter periplasmic adaptor subunit [Spirosoma utsteinense]|uniref:efflux RND transporter periplasmic adaptor subunit n=1 Tax=Spirosoma utsteinense TaxID=2585773 RepID=UPI0016481EE8|nr:efflux RND transporter periplasmic adaptor subunit [Spirosoma utsteinense]MBC3784886.1 cobalt-zinc-cadmium efflux system membrane fusion protein [Spirosoma utsteinense]